jgi:predicted ribosomally synthesized peptide with nif11-like leader
MKESLATFRKAVNESADLQEKLKGGTDLVELGKENGHDFSVEDVKAAYEELKDSEKGLTEFELEAVSGGASPWQSTGEKQWNAVASHYDL